MKPKNSAAPAGQEAESSKPAAGGPPWRTFFKSLIALVPTANALLLVIQSVLAQPPYAAAVPAWVFVAVNAAIIVGVAVARMIVIIAESPLLRNGNASGHPPLPAEKEEEKK